MKKILAILAMLLLGACSNQNSKVDNENTNNTEQQTIKQDKQTKETNKKFSKKEIEKHNNPNDCWTIINNKVYDITSFFGKHPGGDDKLSLICGKDGSNLFNNKHGHSENAKNKLKSFYLGDLN